MSTFKRTKVVMLPTKEKVKGHKLWLNMNDQLIHTTTNTPALLKPQHLYFLSNDKIKGGDWVIGQTASGLWELYGKMNPEKIQDANKDPDYYKIIATTDKSLKIIHTFGSHGISMFKSLPEPSQGFIEKYCEKGSIDEVMVEYETIKMLTRITMTPYIVGSQPKVSSDNTITIRPVKDSWNKEEVTEKLREFAYSGYSKEQVLKWAEKNL